MIGAYTVSVIGDSHKALVGGVCQDFSESSPLEGGRYVAAVADGVGSAHHSDVGSRIAVQTLIAYLEKTVHAAMDLAACQSALAQGFSEAFNAVNRQAQEDGIHISEYDTTLTAVIYDGSDVAVGHVGDGGVIALGANGKYSLLTEAQKGDSFNEVVPLRGGSSHWVFRSYEGPFASVALMTDGIFDVACPWLLSETAQPVFIGFMRPFMDNGVVQLSSESEFEIMAQQVRLFLDSDTNPQITDDKTIAVMINTAITPALLSDEYYAIPDWEALNAQKLENLYDADDLSEESQHGCSGSIDLELSSPNDDGSRAASNSSSASQITCDPDPSSAIQDNEDTTVR